MGARDISYLALSDDPDISARRWDFPPAGIQVILYNYTSALWCRYVHSMHVCAPEREREEGGQSSSMAAGQLAVAAWCHSGMPLRYETGTTGYTERIPGSVDGGGGLSAGHDHALLMQVISDGARSQRCCGLGTSLAAVVG